MIVQGVIPNDESTPDAEWKQVGKDRWVLYSSKSVPVSFFVNYPFGSGEGWVIATGVKEMLAQVEADRDGSTRAFMTACRPDDVEVWQEELMAYWPENLCPIQRFLVGPDVGLSSENFVARVARSRKPQRKTGPLPEDVFKAIPIDADSFRRVRLAADAIKATGIKLTEDRLFHDLPRPWYRTIALWEDLCRLMDEGETKEVSRLLDTRKGNYLMMKKGKSTASFSVSACANALEESTGIRPDEATIIETGKEQGFELETFKGKDSAKDL